MKIIDNILGSELFQKEPPILLDIGASIEVHAKWKPLARYSVCLAFDADARDFRVSEEGSGPFRRLFTWNRIVVPETAEHADFHLTEFPYCSSTLLPDMEKLLDWVIRPRFQVQKTLQLPAITVAAALREAGLGRIDWFKSDSQGTDLRLFMSLPNEVRQEVLAAEFEPGIIDAYQGEDKLHMVMGAMDQHGFWLSAMKVQGVQRLSPPTAEQLGKAAVHAIRKSPCWAEVCYLRNHRGRSERQLLLLAVFALIEAQWGFALEVAQEGKTLFANPLFEQLERVLFRRLLRRRAALPLVFVKRKLTRLLALVDG